MQTCACKLSASDALVAACAPAAQRRAYLYWELQGGQPPARIGAHTRGYLRAHSCSEKPEARITRLCRKVFALTCGDTPAGDIYAGPHTPAHAYACARQSAALRALSHL
eukprot:3182303-Pleurochrysis_carterae.AAC.1